MAGQEGILEQVKMAWLAALVAVELASELEVRAILQAQVLLKAVMGGTVLEQVVMRLVAVEEQAKLEQMRLAPLRTPWVAMAEMEVPHLSRVRQSHTLGVVEVEVIAQRQAPEGLEVAEMAALLALLDQTHHRQIEEAVVVAEVLVRLPEETEVLAS